MKYWLILIIICLSISCRYSEKAKFKVFERNGLIIKGAVINDTIFDDTIMYFNKKNILNKIEVYHYGMLNGTTISYYENGTPQSKVNYTNGIMNGSRKYYEIDGKLYYEDFYYYNLLAGPIIYYKKNGQPKNYTFTNLQNETILFIDYDSWEGVQKIVPDCINYTYNTQVRDGEKEISLFVFLMKPPKLNFSYSVFERSKKSKNSYKEVESLSSTLPFKEITLPVLPDEMIYSVGVKIYDSLLKREVMVYKDFQ